MLNTAAHTERVFISLGSNLGDRVQHLNRALVELRRYALIKRRSSLYETEPVGYANQGWFLNIVVELETNLSPYTLLADLKTIEKILGREETVRFGPRIIDLDILLYGARIIKTPTLAIPHAKMHRRAFVLIPLAEIASDAVHPVLRKTIQELHRELPHDQEKILLYERYIPTTVSRC